jgi:hypothetical protein
MEEPPHRLDLRLAEVAPFAELARSILIRLNPCGLHLAKVHQPHQPAIRMARS